MVTIGYGTKITMADNKGVTEVYRGWIRYIHGPKEQDIVCLHKLKKGGVTNIDSGDYRPLSVIVGDDITIHGRYLSVRYYIFDLELSEEEMREAWVEHMLGVGEANFNIYCTETGYLYTDDELNVGGHSLLEELDNFKGDFCQLEITYYKNPLEI